MKIEDRKQDYPELENVPFDYVMTSGRSLRAKAVGCNRAVGITVVDAEFTVKKLLCLNGPSAKEYSAKSKTAYMTGFDHVIRGIKAGKYYAGKLDIIVDGKKPEGFGTVAPCAYSGE